MEEHFVYIIYSDSNNIYYKGYTTHPNIRIYEHNNGLSRYTKDKGPWAMIYLEKCNSKNEALIREKQLKKYNHDYIRILIRKPENLIK